MLRILLHLAWGLWLMSATVTTEPLSVILVPDSRLTPANILALGTAPSGGSASDGTTATQTDYEVEVTRGSSNVTDVNGYHGAEVVAVGSPSSALTLTTTTAIPGIPGTTARYTYSDGTNTYGASEPYVFAGIETVQAATSGNGYQQGRSIATPDGRVHIVYEDWVNNRVRYEYRDPNDTYSTAVTVWDSPVDNFASDYSPFPDIYWVRSDTSVGYVLFVGSWYSTSTSTKVFRMSQSEDGGTTWSSYDSDLTRSFSASSIDSKTRLAYDPVSEQVTLVFRNFVTGPTYQAETFISNDPTGARWESLADGTIASVVNLDLVSYCGQIILAYQATGNTNAVIARRDGTAIDWQTASSDTGYNFDEAYELALTVNDSGWLYLSGRADADEDLLVLQVSTNGGVNWGAPDGTHPYRDSGGTIIINDDGDTVTSLTLGDGLLATGAAWVGETMYLVGGLVTSATTVDNSVMLAKFGGISNITLDSNPSATDAPAYPCSVPSTKASGYSFVTGGSSATSVTTDTAGDLVIRISADNSTGYVVYTPPGNPTVTAVWTTIGPDTTGADELQSVLVTAQNGGANHYTATVDINANSSTIRGFDVGGASYISTAAAYDNTAKLTVILAVDGNTGRASAYYKQPGDTAFTTLFSNQSITVIAGSPTSTLNIGKTAVTPTVFDIIEIIPFGSASGEFAASIVSGLSASNLVPIRATGTRQAQRLPQDVHVYFRGAPLFAGDTHTIETVSKTPLSRLSPLRSLPSPTLQYVGATGAAGATYRVAYDFGASQETRIAPQSVGIGWANFGPVDEFRLHRWDGSADANILTIAGFSRPFGSDGAVSFARSAAGSLLFTPNGTNGSPEFTQMMDWVDRWVRIGDGTNTILAKITRVFPGQFSNATGVLQASFEIDFSTITVEAGSFASLSTSTTGGTFNLFADDGLALAGGEGIDSNRYYIFEWDLANGATVPQGGFLTAGNVYYLGRPERDGSSIRWITADEVRQMPGTGFIQGEQVRRRDQRVLELPFDTMLVQAGYYGGAGNVINTLAISGTTARATLDNNLHIIQGAHALVGQKTPIWYADWVDFSSTDPSNTNKGVYGRSVVVAQMERQIDRTAARGVLRDRDIHAQQGGRLLLAELI